MSNTIPYPVASTSSAIIRQFNDKAGLLKRGYNARLEASFQVEEAIEGFDLAKIEAALNPALTPIDRTAKDFSRLFLNHVDTDTRITLVEAIDRAADAIVFAYGSLYKLGLSVQQAEDCLTMVAQSVMEKVNAPVDAEGKLTKPVGFIGPEDRIADYLTAIGVDPNQKV